jgi:lactoylglutathione lyase
MAKVIHSMIRVLDEVRSVAFYREAFGLDVANRYEFDAFVLVYLANGHSDFELELTINKGRTEPYDLGDGYGHVAFSVADVEAEHARLTAAGMKPRDIVSFERDGLLFARFFFVADPDGYQIEVLKRHGRFT